MRLATGCTRGMGRVAVVAAILVALVALSGCGAQETAAQATAAGRIRGKVLTIYASVPLSGISRLSGTAAVSGAQLALAEARGHIGEYRIEFKVLDDATAASGGWDPGQTTINARMAVLDPTTIAYLGELNSGASAVSIPPLNRADIPQVSPSSSAVGLTSTGPSVFPGEPQKYYPSGLRTFARIVPNDSVQANAQVRAQQAIGCRTTYVLDDGEVDGADAARSFEVAAHAARLPLAGIQRFPRNATSYMALAAGVAQIHPGCVLISGDTESGAVLLTEQLAAAMPDVKIFGTAGLAESAYIDPAQGGIPLAVASRVLLTAPTLGAAQDPASPRGFAAAYERRYGPMEPTSVFGYEAMSLLLSAIARATHGGTEPAARADVRAALFATHGRHSVLGTYSIDRNGDTTLTRYGMYAIVAGRLTLLRVIAA